MHFLVWHNMIVWKMNLNKVLKLISCCYFSPFKFTKLKTNRNWKNHKNETNIQNEKKYKENT